MRLQQRFATTQIVSPGQNLQCFCQCSPFFSEIADTSYANKKGASPSLGLFLRFEDDRLALSRRDAVTHSAAVRQ